MFKVLSDIAVKKTYWLVLIGFAVSMELVALYYQYALDEWPCVVCIQTRIWLMALIIVSVVVLLVEKIVIKNLVGHSLVTIIMLGLLDRAWILLGVERGTIFGSCDMDLGLPVWLAVDKWLPFIFEVKTACGYTPVLLLNITMAEALMAFSSLMLIVSSMMLLSVSLRFYRKH